jgi:hypothetical protein
MRVWLFILGLLATPLSAQSLLVERAQSLELPAPNLALQLRADLGDEATTALKAGIVLAFDVQWQLADERVLKQSLALSYSPLLDQYQLRIGDRAAQRYGQRNTLLAALENAQLSWPDAAPCASACGGRVRIELDRSRLPAPLRLKALTDPDWQLDSEWTTLDL